MGAISSQLLCPLHMLPSVFEQCLAQDSLDLSCNFLDQNMILPFLPGAPVAFSINGLEKPNLSSKFVYVIEMSLVPDREQSYGVYACVCVYTCTHTQTHT